MQEPLMDINTLAQSTFYLGSTVGGKEVFLQSLLDATGRPKQVNRKQLDRNAEWTFNTVHYGPDKHSISTELTSRRLSGDEEPMCCLYNNSTEVLARHHDHLLQEPDGSYAFLLFPDESSDKSEFRFHLYALKARKWVSIKNKRMLCTEEKSDASVFFLEATPSDKVYTPYTPPPVSRAPFKVPAREPLTTSAEWQRVFEKFAPEVLLHPDEDNFPSSVDWYLQRVAAIKHDRHGNASTLKPPMTSQQLKNFIHPNNAKSKIPLWENEGLHFSDTYLPSGSCDSIGYQFYDHKVRKGQKGAVESENPPPVYVRKILNEFGTYDLQYWFFYPFNGAHYGFADHVGDWEHISIRLNADRSDWVALFTSSHENKDPRKQWHPKAVVQSTDGQHPTIYSSWHSHACGVVAGVYNVGGVVDDKFGKGKSWKTWKNVIEIEPPFRDPPLNHQYWTCFNGRWGQRISLTVPSPTGPMLKDQFVWGDEKGPNPGEHPVYWSQARDIHDPASSGTENLKTDGAFAAAYYSGRFYLIYKNAGDAKLYYRVYTGDYWAREKPILDAEGAHCEMTRFVSACTYNDQLHIVYSDANLSGQLVHMCFDEGQLWSHKHQITGVRPDTKKHTGVYTEVNPSMTVHKGKLYLCYVLTGHHNHQIFLQTYDHSIKTPDRAKTFDSAMHMLKEGDSALKTGGGLSIASFKGTLYCVRQKPKHHSLLMHHYDDRSQTWSAGWTPKDKANGRDLRADTALQLLNVQDECLLVGMKDPGSHSMNISMASEMESDGDLNWTQAMAVAADPTKNPYCNGRMTLAMNDQRLFVFFSDKAAAIQETQFLG